MSRMNMTEWARSVIESPDVKAIPIMTHPGIEMSGISVRQAVTDGVSHAIAISKLNDYYPAAATTVIMDLTVEAEAFGANIVFEESNIPTVTGRLVCDEASVRALMVPDVLSARVPEFIRANTLTAEKIIGKPVFAGCIGPFSLAGRLFDMSEMLMSIYIEPDIIHALLDKCTSFITAYIQAIKNSGVNGVIVAEPAAGLITNDDCITFSSDYIKRIITAVQDDNFMVVLHNCGNTGHCTDAMIKTGAAAYHFGNQANMVDALRTCPSDSLVMGNIDPVGIMKMASEEKVRTTVLDLLEKTSSFSNYVLSTGCDVPPETPEKNIRAFYSALEEFNNRK